MVKISWGASVKLFPKRLRAVGRAKGDPTRYWQKLYEVADVFYSHLISPRMVGFPYP
jgi:hypothetical protein